MPKDIPEELKQQLIETPITNGKVGYAAWVKKRINDENDKYYDEEDSEEL